MFGVRGLTSKESIRNLVNQTIIKSDNLLSQVLKQTSHPNRNTLKLVDGISNTVCLTIDPLMACRHLHYDTNIRQTAWDGVVTLQKYLDRLNNNPDLYRMLIDLQQKISKSSPGEWTEEEQEIVTSSIKEAKLRGCAAFLAHPDHSVENKEKIFKEIENIQANMFRLESEFMDQCHIVKKGQITVPIIPKLSLQGSSTPNIIDVNHRTYIDAMRNWTSESKRKEMFDMYFSEYQERLASLQQLREARHTYAVKLGFKSYSELQARNSLLGNVKDIEDYLLEHIARLKNTCDTTCNDLKRLKAKCSDDMLSSAQTIQAWDTIFLKRLLVLEQTSKNPALEDFHQFISSHLNLDHVFQSLARLVDMCFNLELQRVPIESEELWLPFDIKKNTKTPIWKCELRNPVQNELIGIIYIDLFDRHAKESQVFPIRCSYVEDNVRQVPSVVISQQWPSNDNDNDNRQWILPHSQWAKSLLHEFGHALHYVMSQTEYQMLSGSRGLCTEYAELPSTMMEKFGYDSLFIKNVILDGASTVPMRTSNGKKIDKQLTDEIFSTYLRKLEYSSCHPLEASEQLYHSLWDIKLFGDESLQKYSVEEIFKQVYRPLIETFGGGHENEDKDMISGYIKRGSRHIHFVDYAANYHAYARASDIIPRIWKETFGKYEQDGQKMDFKQYREYCRHYGSRLQSTILSKGSAIPPLKAINDFIGRDNFFHSENIKK